MYVNGAAKYLGKWGTKEAQAAYHEFIAQWLVQGGPPEVLDGLDSISVGDVMLAFLRHAKEYYVKAGSPTSEVAQYKAAIKVVLPVYGDLPASEFGPVKLQHVRQSMIELGWSRGTIN